MKKRPKRRKRPRGKKKPEISWATKPSVGKTPSFPSFDPEHYRELQPAWRVSRLEAEGPFGWGKISRGKAREVLAKLGNFESMTWHEILVKGKHWHHTISIAKLAKIAQDRLIEIELDDLDDLISLRLSSTERIWGFRDDHIFEILWWDPEHQVCPSAKKHT